MTILLLKLIGWLPNILGFATQLVGKLSTDATTRYTAGTASSTAIVQASTAADVAVNTLREKESEANARWWVTAWEKPLLFYLCLLHFGGIMIDTTFHMHWGIPAPPPPFDTYEGIILLSDVLVLSTAGLTSKVVSAIWK
jgi:hypothetical protein